MQRHSNRMLEKGEEAWQAREPRRRGDVLLEVTFFACLPDGTKSFRTMPSVSKDGTGEGELNRGDRKKEQCLEKEEVYFPQKRRGQRRR